MQQAELPARGHSITDPKPEGLLGGWKGCDRNNPSKLPIPHFNSLTVTTLPLNQILAAQPQPKLGTMTTPPSCVFYLQVLSANVPMLS